MAFLIKADSQSCLHASVYMNVRDVAFLHKNNILLWIVYFKCWLLFADAEYPVVQACCVK